MKREDEKSAPIITESGSDGSQTIVGSSVANYHVTKSKIPNQPVANVLMELAREDSRSLGNPTALKLATASYVQIQQDKNDLQQQLDTERERRINSEQDNAVLRGGIRGKRKSSVGAAFLLILGPLLISFGVDYQPNAEITWLFLPIVLGLLSILIGLVLQFFNPGEIS